MSHTLESHSLCPTPNKHLEPLPLGREHSSSLCSSRSAGLLLRQLLHGQSGTVGEAALGPPPSEGPARPFSFWNGDENGDELSLSKGPISPFRCLFTLGLRVPRPCPEYDCAHSLFPTTPGTRDHYCSIKGQISEH